MRKIRCRHCARLGAELAPPLKEAPKSVLLYLAGVAGKRCCFTGHEKAWRDCSLGMSLVRDTVKNKGQMVKLDDLLSGYAMVKTACSGNKNCLEGAKCVFERMNHAYL